MPKCERMSECDLYNIDIVGSCITERRSDVSCVLKVCAAVVTKPVVST